LPHKISVGAGVVEKLHSQIVAVFSSVHCSVIPSMEQLQLDIDTVRVFGVSWEPEEFCKEACLAEHPLSVQSVLPAELLSVIEYSVRTNPVEVAKERLRYLLKWNKRARELEADEVALKNGMDPIVKRAVANKRILLFEEMLADCDYPDQGVVKELKDGAELFGEVSPTGMLPNSKVLQTCIVGSRGLGETR